LTIALTFAALGLVLSTIVTPSGGSGARALVPQARPLWYGDTFKTVRTNELLLPPYQYSSASGLLSGWDHQHSNTDPNVEGVAVVDDPLGLKSTTDPSRAVRKVIKITTDEHLRFDGYVRAQLRSPPLLGAGEHRWVIAEVYIPPGTPVMPDAPGTFWTILSIFGPPYNGSGPDSISLDRNRAGTGNDITWRLPDGDVIWRTPATPGVWHIVAQHIFLSSDPAKGFSEIWYSQRRPDGTPRMPLTRQMIGGADGIPLTYRRYYATLDPAHNWDGTPDSVNLANYHSANIWPGRRFISLYFARYRIYDGRTSVREIDPYYTGLR
jgi:hypothetical protein